MSDEPQGRGLINNKRELDEADIIDRYHIRRRQVERELRMRRPSIFMSDET